MDIPASLSSKLRIAMVILFAMFVMRGFAQTKVKASQIMSDIKDGKSISIENATIVGDLDFTYMVEKLPDLPSKSKWWNSGSNEVDESIEVQVSFKNCTFEDDVLAYIHDDESNYTFTADFEKKVTFENCVFERNAMFKYSDFDDVVSFSGSKFQRKSTFKYAEFDEMADFSQTRFDDDATFKYAEFDEGGSFRNAVFEEDLNIKYLEARGDFVIDGMDVKDDIDAKYTKINGQSFTNYLVKSRN